MSSSPLSSCAPSGSHDEVSVDESGRMRLLRRAGCTVLRSPSGTSSSSSSAALAA